MLYVEKKDIHEKRFVELLTATRQNSLNELEKQGSQAKTISSLGFEKLVFDQMSFAARNTEFDQNIRQGGPHGFPDIIAEGYFGAEIKMTTGDKWLSTGNSVLESTRPEDVQKIYIFFGKFGGKIDIKYRTYQECLYDIGVTHSPRYKINMDLPKGAAIFDKMGIAYDALRKESNPIKKIKEYYRSMLDEGEELWWIDTQVEEDSTIPVIKSFRKLNGETQEKFMIEAMILFPEIFGSSPTKFERIATYLVMNYSAVSSNLRDLFTAGGRVNLIIKNKNTRVPKIFFKLFINAKTIAHALESIDCEKLSYQWRIYQPNKPKIYQWMTLLNHHSTWHDNGLRASDIFEAGLREKTL
jgi:hypothetical protein